MRDMSTIRHIRKHVFQMNQADFAARIGVMQSTVSRWENGTEPDRADLMNIRAAAASAGLPWDDAWLFDTPSKETA
jgi:DNA-binding transcriptional regulator YiaG